MGPDRARLLRLAAELHREGTNLDRVVGEVSSALALLAARAPSSLELRGSADLLHDWYTGLEKLLQLVAVTIDGGVPEGDRWHRRLLDAMTVDVPGLRPPVLSSPVAAAVEPYLRFGHVFRNLYGFDLDWEQIRPLLERLPGVHGALVVDLRAFEELLRSLAS